MIFLVLAIRFVVNFLKARHEELIVWRIDECSLLLGTIYEALYEVLQMGRKRKEGIMQRLREVNNEQNKQISVSQMTMIY